MSKSIVKSNMYQLTYLITSSSSESISSMTGNSIVGMRYSVTPVNPAAEAYLAVNFGGVTPDTVFYLSGNGNLGTLKFATCPRNAGTPDGTINIVPTNAI